MAEDEATPAQAGPGGKRTGVLNLRAQGAKTSYANLAVLTTTREEVVMHFGINVNPPTSEGEVNVEVTDRIIMSYPAAKRLAITLGNLIQRYESKQGVIDVGRQPPVAPQADATRPGADV